MLTARTMTECRSAATRVAWKSILQAVLMTTCFALLYAGWLAPLGVPLSESVAEVVQDVVPPVAGFVGLLELVVFFVIVVCCFGQWCLMQAAIRPADFAILSRLYRLISLPFSICHPLASPISPYLAKTGSPLRTFSLRRTASPTAADSAGAAPLLI